LVVTADPDYYPKYLSVLVVWASINIKELAEKHVLTKINIIESILSSI